MKSKTLGVLAVGLLAWPMAVTANVVLQYGGSAGIGIRDCSVGPGCSNEANLPPLAFQQVNAPNLPGLLINTTGFSAYDASLATGPSGQQTFWNGSDAGPFGSPTIHAAAYTADSRVSSGGWLLQSYTWNGMGPATRTISGTLTYSESGGFPDLGGGLIDAGLSIFTTGANTAVLLDSHGCGFGGLTSDQGYTCIQNSDILASNLVSLNSATTNGTFDLNLPSITLNSSGETIFVLMSLVTWGKTGGYADASHTFVTTFDNTTGLTPAVPEPATLALLGIGLAGLGFSRRRKPN